jgi:hypothetical protein
MFAVRIGIEPGAAVTGGAKPVRPSHRYSWLRAILQREALGAPICPFCQMVTPLAVGTIACDPL